MTLRIGPGKAPGPFHVHGLDAAWATVVVEALAGDATGRTPGCMEVRDADVTKIRDFTKN